VPSSRTTTFGKRNTVYRWGDHVLVVSSSDWDGAQQVPPVKAVPLEVYKVAAIARDVLLSESARGGMTRC